MLIRWIHVVCKQCVLRLKWNGIKWGSNNRINWCNVLNRYISNKRWRNNRIDSNNMIILQMIIDRRVS